VNGIDGGVVKRVPGNVDAQERVDRLEQWVKGRQQASWCGHVRRVALRSRDPVRVKGMCHGADGDYEGR
jgi:hypothetical protein